MPRYIDADALKDVIQQHDYPLADRLNSVDNGMFTLGIFQAIDEQPTISPDDARGVGKWIKDNYFAHIKLCSKCGKRKGIYDIYKFCPNCGAKMEVSEDA